MATTTTTPLLQTTPLLYEILNESPEETVFNFRRGISPATTPIKLLISSDWTVGVAMFQPSTVWTVSCYLSISRIFQDYPRRICEERGEVYRIFH